MFLMSFPKVNLKQNQQQLFYVQDALNKGKIDSLLGG